MVDRPLLDDLLRRAKARWDSMTPQQRAEMFHKQRRSYVVSEAGFGSDKDELAYRAAHARGDTAEMARLDAEGRERMRAAGEIFDRMFPDA